MSRPAATGARASVARRARGSAPPRRRTAASALVLALALATGPLLVANVARAAPAASAWSAAPGEAELAAIEGRWRALSTAPRRDPRALAELQARAEALAREASHALGAMREEAAERDADMTAVVASADWRTAEEALLRLRFRIAAIELERALAGDPDKARLAREAAAGFSDFADAPDPTLAAEARYGRGLARIAAGDRAAGLEDLRAAAASPAVAPRARIALAESLASGGDRAQALDQVTRLLAVGGLPRDLQLRAKLLRLQLLLPATGAGKAPPSASPQVAALASELLAAGDPWRAAALALFQGREDLLPAGADADAVLLRLRGDGLLRRGDAAGALAAYRAAVERGGARPDADALEGVARSAVAIGDWDAARSALARRHGIDRAWTRDLALMELRAAYGTWQASPTPENAAALAAAADTLAKAPGATADDRAEAAFRAAEAARAAGDLDRAIAALQAIDAPAWRAAAGTAALQARALRAVRDPAREPRAPLLRDVDDWIARRDLPADARATAIALDGTLRTTGAPAASRPTGAASDGDAALDARAQRAALERLRAFPKDFPNAAALLPAVLRARALLEVQLGERPDPGMLQALPEAARPAVAADIAGDLRQAVADAVVARDEADEARARDALAAAVAFGALGPEAERGKGRIALADAALALGDAATAVALFQAELAAKPDSLSALRGLALAAAAAGDADGARGAWRRLADRPDLPPALREEAERNAGAGAAAAAR